jgi:predicted regulator of Ras-like GTPase activity (Roadblock/LC7/MglB family)
MNSNNNTFHQSYDKQKILSVINEMKNIGGLTGVIFADCNGELIAENFSEDFDGNKFAAMCASLIESAEGIAETTGSNKIGNIITELENGQMIIILNCDDNSFFSFVLEKESKFEPIIKNIEKYKRKINITNKDKKKENM